MLVERGTSNLEILRQAKEDSAMHDYYHNVILAGDTESHYVNNLDEALQRVRTEEKTLQSGVMTKIYGVSSIYFLK